MLDPALDPAVPPVSAAGSDRLAVVGHGLDRSLALLAGISFAAQAIVGAMLPVLPVFAQSLGATPTMLALMVSISAVAAACGQLVGGIVSDRSGARRLLPAGLLAYGAASLATVVATAAPPVVLLRSLSGLGSGTYLVGERLYIRQVVDRARLAFGNSLVQAAAAVGLIVGPVFGGIVADASDLRTPIAIAGLLSVVVAAIAMLLPARRHPNAASGLVAGEAVRSPRRGLAVLLVANLGLAAGYGSFITTFAPFATDTINWTATQTGIAFALFGLGNVAVSPLLGAAADRWGRRLVGSLATVPIVLFAVALVLPVPTALFFPLAFAAGAGVAGFNAAWYTLLGLATGGPGGGRAFGTIAGLSSLGIVLGALLAGWMWEAISIQAGMVITVIAMATAGVALAGYPELRPKDGTLQRPGG